MNQNESLSLSENEMSEEQAPSYPIPEAPEESDKTQQADHPHRQQYEQFLKDLEQQLDAEAKLQLTIGFMENSLSQSGIPHFKSFWDARALCLMLFKENINPAVRSLMWAKYNELSKEARRLKEILDEQSAFAVEQIEIAIKALEDDIEQFESHLEKAAWPDFPSVLGQSLQNKLPYYREQQHRLNMLNAQAARITAMRKELIKTDMRVRQKNKFFQRLSAAGDHVFPKRKDLIREVSQAFLEDVDAFIQKYFAGHEIRDSLFYLREEIKGFQNMAKILTLNTHAFTHTRMRLSECWDQLKNLDKERKKERAHQKTAFKQNLDEVLKKLTDYKQLRLERKLSLNESEKHLDEIASFSRGIELGREEIAQIRSEFNTLRKELKDEERAFEEEKRKHDQEKEQSRRNKVHELKTKIENLLGQAESLDADKITTERDDLLQVINGMPLSKSEKQELERQLKPLRDLINDKRESALLTLSDDDRQSLQQYREILKQRKERRQEIKNQLELLRKASGSSGLDFEQAMAHNKQLEAEKERLEKINQGIDEIIEKIAELEKKVS